MKEEQEMLSHMLQSRAYQMVKQLNRIERYVKKKPLAKKDTESCFPYEERTIKEIYDDFQDEYWLFLKQPTWICVLQRTSEERI